MNMTSTTTQFDLLIDGQLRPATPTLYFDSINPSNGMVVARVADASETDMQQAIKAARRIFDEGAWIALSNEQRGEYLKKIGAAVRAHAKPLAALEGADTGKTTKQTTFIDVPTCAETFEYFAQIANPLKDVPQSLAAPVKSVVRRVPMGVVASIIPWNYPLIMAAWKIAPALMAGNAVILKPSPVACAAVMRLAQLIQEVGLPKGLVQVVPTSRDTVAEVLIESPLVDMISFTGGTATGQRIARQAAVTIKKLSLELGAKSPTVVFDDCPLDVAVGGAMTAIFMNQGQMCTAGSRLFVQDAIYDNFIEKLVAKTKALVIGDAADYATTFGPLVSRAHRDQVLQAIKKGQAEGAQLIYGGTIPEDEHLANGAYLIPAIFTGVTPAMTLMQEEIFGPVLCISKFSTLDEVVALANDSKYGLAASVWTQDSVNADQVARRLQCGTVWVNTYGGFYNEVAFGGCKLSGHGRELGDEGVKSYTRTQHICRDQTPGGMPLVAAWF